MKNKFFGSLKLAGAMLMSPVVLGMTFALGQGLRELPGGVFRAFMEGVVVYLVLHVFLHEPAVVYEAGTNLTKKTFFFLPPLVKIVAFCVPIFSLIFLALYFFSTVYWQSFHLFPHFMFLAAFMLALHLVFTANSLKDRKDDVLKANYLFVYSWVYMINIILVAATLSALTQEFSFGTFIRQTWGAAWDIYDGVFRQLFVVTDRAPV